MIIACTGCAYQICKLVRPWEVGDHRGLGIRSGKVRMAGNSSMTGERCGSYKCVINLRMRIRSSRPPPLKLYLNTKMPAHSPVTPCFRSRFITQVGRFLSAYLLVILLVLFFTNSYFFTAPVRATQKYRCERKYQRPIQAELSIISRKVWQT